MGIRLFSVVKIIASAGICGIGAAIFFIKKNIDGRDGLIPDESERIKSLLFTIIPPILSAIIAYKNSDSTLVIKHEFATNEQRDIAMHTISKMV